MQKHSPSGTGRPAQHAQIARRIRSHEVTPFPWAFAFGYRSRLTSSGSPSSCPPRWRGPTLLPRRWRKLRFRRRCTSARRNLELDRASQQAEARKASVASLHAEQMKCPLTARRCLCVLSHRTDHTARPSSELRRGTGWPFAFAQSAIASRNMEDFGMCVSR